MASSSHTRTPSWTVVVLMLVLPIVICVPATATSTIEHCIRLLLSPPPPPPPPAAAGSRPTSDLGRVVCRDQFRVVGFYLRSKGKLPLSYLEALCNIFGDDEQKVERYITNTFKTYDFHRLMAGRSCATIRKKQHPPPPSS